MLLRCVEWGSRLVIRLGPPAYRAEWRDEQMTTLRMICSDAYRQQGAMAAVATALAEWWSVLVAAVRVRIGRPIGITSGQTRPPSDGPRRQIAHRFIRDLRHAFRSLAAARGHTLLVVLTLALGIGVNTAVFSVLDSILFRPIPYAEAERVVALWSYFAPGKFYAKGHFTPALVVEWRKQTDLFDRVEAYERRSIVYEAPGGAEMVTGSLVTPGLLSMLGVSPLAGRTFGHGDGRDGSDRSVIVSERFWSEQLGRGPDLIGRRIVLDGKSYDVVGIMPRSFRYPDQAQQLWIPFDVERPPSWASTTRMSLVPTVRLRHDVTIAQIAGQVPARGASLNRAAGGDGQSSAGIMKIGELFNDRTKRSLFVLGGAVVFLLLIVCANVASLTLARTLARSRDASVRAALGASRGDLVREQLSEHLLLGGAGAALGLLIAHVTLAATTSMLPDEMTLASLNAIDLDHRALAFLSAISIFTVLLFGLPTALSASRASVVTALGRDSRSFTRSRSARRFRSGLVVVEMMLSIVLLAGAALMTRSLMKLQAIDVGLETDGLVAMNLAFPAPAFANQPLRDRFTNDLIARLRVQPGITAASAGKLPPNEVMITVGRLEFSDRPGEVTKQTLLSVYDTWPGYFAAAGIRMLSGRDFRDNDIEGAAIVSEGFVARYLAGRSPLGLKFRVGDHPWRTIVGVANEVRQMSEEDDSKKYELYYPHDQVSGVMGAVRPGSTIADYRTFLVRADAPGAAVKSMAQVVHELDSRVIVTKSTLVAHQFADAIARPRVVFLMMTVFAGVGLILATAGLYGVLAYLVAQRRREIGIRIAIGAQPSDVRRAVLRTGLGLAAIGLVLGFVAAIPLVRVMRSVLYEVDPFDPVSAGGVAVVMAGAAVIACWRPVLQALRIDPVTLLRES